MLQLLEILPLVIFVSVYSLHDRTLDVAGFHYTFDGIYSATAALMIATCLQVLVVWLLKRKVEKRLLWLLAAVLVFGSATLILHNKLFIQWKPTVFNWAMCLVLLCSHWFGRNNLIEKLLGEQLPLPTAVYTRLGFVWAGYFFIVGALNLVVAFNFSESTWVHYKLWSSVAFTVTIMIVSVIMMFPYLKDLPDNTDSESRTPNENEASK